MRSVIEIPLFPLRSVLCPGVALPLHIFEERYRLMVNRCIERGEPFGVVLLRDGREVGPLRGQVAGVGTTAAIRRAGAYPDGRLDIITVGQQRFRLEGVDNVSEPYLVGQISLLDEPTGPEDEATHRAQRVGQRFIEYLELLQPEGVDDGPEIEIEFEVEVDEPDDDSVAPAPESGAAAADPDDVMTEATDALVQEMDASDLSSEQRRELLMAAARRLTGTDDPTALSYVLTALVQVDLAARQELLEAPDTVERLARLDGLLTRESWFLRQGLRPIIIDPAGSASRQG
ncbi:MAG: LON peptidase substrate-binding domain-containing protein [Candidatus Limnocylindrales bacterium]